MDKIKTREKVKDIKVFDRAADVSTHIKNTFVKSKDTAEQTQESGHNSPSEYATENISGGARNTAEQAAHHLKNPHKKATDNWDKAKQNLQEAKRQLPKERKQAAEQAKKTAEKAQKTADTLKGKANQAQKTAQEAQKAVTDAKRTLQQTRQAGRQSVQTARQSVKTSRQAEKGIKHSVKTIKQAGKGTVKAARKSVKTAKHSAKIAVKTANQAAKTAQKSAQAAAKAAKAATQASRAAAKTAAKTAKAAVKATIATVKAIIASTKALISAIIAGGWVAVLIILIVVLLGGVLSLIGGGNDSSSYTPVSAEVEAYEPLIRQYATQHGISEYVELIKAVMMQESGGRGNDPMQASECGCNTRYPNTPGEITDPEYSINVGIQNLAACLSAAEVENPIDMDNIKTALQGYNYGNGYISWAKSNYGGYTYANALEFSTMMAERLGWASYGDMQYVSHVLRYYPFGKSTGMGNGVIVEIALSQEGNVGGQPYWSWYGFDSRVEWCACFVSWCAEQCGYLDAGIIPRFSLCTDGVSWFQSKGQWQDASYTPSPGDIIFFDWESDGSSDHVGIVEYVKNGIVHTIEGNSSDSCRRRSYSIGSSVIVGYGVPIY